MSCRALRTWSRCCDGGREARFTKTRPSRSRLHHPPLSPRASKASSRESSAGRKIATGEIHWRSITRDNVTTLYGKNNDSRIFDPADPSPANPTPRLQWLICESYDDKGNAIVYEYAAENDGQGQSEPGQRAQPRAHGQPLSEAHQVRQSRLAPRSSRTSSDGELAVRGGVRLRRGPLRAGCTRSCAPRGRAASLRAGAASIRDDNWASARTRSPRTAPGFEVRSYRRCRRVLMFHHFADLPTGEKGYAVWCDLPSSSTPTCRLQSRPSRRSWSLPTKAAPVTRPSSAELRSQGTCGTRRRPWSCGTASDTPPTSRSRCRRWSSSTARHRSRKRFSKLDAESLENLPVGLDGSYYQWVDLDGEGLSGILTEQAGAWFYKPNLGGGRFGSLETRRGEALPGGVE